jgi:hypothetical protein
MRLLCLGVFFLIEEDLKVTEGFLSANDIMGNTKTTQVSPSSYQALGQTLISVDYVKQMSSTTVKDMVLFNPSFFNPYSLL